MTDPTSLGSAVTVALRSSVDNSSRGGRQRFSSATSATLIAVACLASPAPAMAAAPQQRMTVRQVGPQVASGEQPGTRELGAAQRSRIAIEDATMTHPRPFVYRTDEGGYQLEWSTSTHELSVEILLSGDVYVHATDVDAMLGDGHEIPASRQQASQVAAWLTDHLS